MKRFWILVEIDVQTNGFNAKKVYMYDNKEQAVEKMRKLYLKAFEHYNDTDDNPFAEDNYDYQFTENYAFVSNYYYLDIFNTDLYMDDEDN